MTDAPTDVRSWLQAELPRAMKARDRAAVAALRSALDAIGHAEAGQIAAGSLARHDAPIAGSVPGLRAAEVARRTLSPAAVERVVRAEIDDREQAARDYDASDRTERADRLRREAAVLRDLLDAD